MPDTQNRLLGPSGQATPSFAAYSQQGGYTALRQALTNQSPAQVLAEITAANLRGRGGAGVYAAEKLRLVASSDDTERYLVCNAYDADERSGNTALLLERNPHLVIEGMLLAAYAAGIAEGFLYLRSSREAAVEAAHTALREAQEKGLLGRSILGSAFTFTINAVGVERGFMGGEESSVIEILKGRPLKAQQRPPYPTTAGYGGHPTAVQAAETLANLPLIVGRGAQEFRKVGTKETPGTKLLTVHRPGQTTPVVVEVPFGMTIAQVLNAVGAPANAQTARAVVVGGREGGVLPLDALNTVLDYETLEDVGAILGAGVVEVLPRDECMVRWAKDNAHYLAGQSCGKCVPCRVGGKRIAGTLEGIVSNLGTKEDMALLEEFTHYVADGSLCGFGVNEVNGVATAMRYFGDDFTAHLEGRCPTGTCQPVRSHRFVTKHVL